MRSPVASESRLNSERIAHDFNNLLFVISASAEFLESSTPEDDPRYDDVINIREAADRAATLIRETLFLNQSQVPASPTFSLNLMLRRMQPVLEGIANASGKVRCVMELDPTAGEVRADIGHIEQLLMNLVMNARDAMSGQGELTLRTQRVTQQANDACEESWIQLVVQDTGVGMSETVLARAFEPFFTTKDRELGTGLGLATVAGIVRESGGEIAMHSTPGVGTRVEVRLPAVEMAGAWAAR